MKIRRAFNNNVVSVTDGQRESILTGKGIGYNKRVGDNVDVDLIEKRYVLDEPGVAASFDGLLAQLPYEIIVLADRVAELAEQQLGLVMKPAMHFGLADHLVAALHRAKHHQRLENPLLWEIRSAYRPEFTTALDAVRLIEQHAGTELPIDEVGYLTMHLVNASLTGDMRDTLRTASTVQEIMTIIRQHFVIASAVDSSDYLRFLTHVKYFVQRLEDGALLRNQQPEMFAVLKAADPLVYKCAADVAEFAATRYSTEVPDDELLYLMLHVTRIRDRSTSN